MPRRSPNPAQNKNRALKVAVYIRVSTVSQNLAGQKAAIKRWLKAKGIPAKNVQWFEDKKSGDNIERPAFEAMQNASPTAKCKRSSFTNWIASRERLSTAYPCFTIGLVTASVLSA